jgi:hypothetical protein
LWRSLIRGRESRSGWGEGGRRGGRIALREHLRVLGRWRPEVGMMMVGDLVEALEQEGQVVVIGLRWKVLVVMVMMMVVVVAICRAEGVWEVGVGLGFGRHHSVKTCTEIQNGKSY